MTLRFVVTGAGRGIGLELVRQIVARGDEADAVVRSPDTAEALRALAASAEGRLRVVPGDVADDESVAALDGALVPGPIDVLVNNAGILGKMGGLGDLETRDLLDAYSTNALGPLRVTRALLPRLKAGTGKRILNVSTGMGSLADNGSGGAYAYRMSKAALNMATVNLAHELRRDAISVISVNPGWVQTDMGGSGANMPVETSARKLLALIDGMTPDRSGAFLNHDGSTFPW